MKRIQLKTLSMIAAVSLLLGVAGCKKTQQHKNRISGRIITENDPFYTAELVDMKIPLDESKELVHVQLDSGLISSDMSDLIMKGTSYSGKRMKAQIEATFLLAPMGNY